MKKKAWLGAILVGGLAGCGGGGGSAPTVQMTGVVVDWYIQDALIFADLNDDGIYQPETEPSTRSGTGGGYQLHVTSDRPYYLISKGGIDTSTSQYYAATLIAEGHYDNITPVTTMDALIVRTGTHPMVADLIVRQLTGMDDPTEPDDSVPLDANPATNKHLLAGSRMFAMYNNALTEVLSQVVKPSAGFTEESLKIKLSRSAWEQLARRVAEEYTPGVFATITPLTLQKTIQYLLAEYGVETQVGVTVLMSDALAETIHNFVKTSTSELALSTHVFGDDDEGDRVYMGDVQDAQDQTIALIIKNASVTGLVPTIQIEGDDDKDEYEH